MLKTVSDSGSVAGHGGRYLVQALSDHGCERVFSVAGESYLPVLDGLLDYPHIDVVTCRQESGVTFMAEAYGNLIGQPGIAMVTRGPGACNASIGVHSAMQASTPLILFVGLIAKSERDKEAFQDFDLPQMFDSLSKWAAVIDDVSRIGEYVARAYHIATSGRPGPVVLGLPEDVLTPEIAIESVPVIPCADIVPSETQMTDIVEHLSRAQRPVILAGGSGWSDQACANLEEFSTASDIPVITAFRRQDIFDHRHSNYIGELGTGPNPALVERMKQADTILVLNERVDEITTQTYDVLQNPAQNIVHVYPDAFEFGKACMPKFTLQSHIDPFCQALSRINNIDGSAWSAWRDDGRSAYEEWSDAKPNIKTDWDGADMSAIFAYLQEALPKDAIVTTDAGNFSGWAQRYLRYGRPGRLLAPVSGAMGYNVPAAVAASMQHPDRVVLGLCGDGGFMMTAQEIATAMKHGSKPILMVCNNGVYGTIRMHQERDFPERHSATSLTNPDFVALTESYGASAWRVRKADEFEAVWQKALDCDTLSVIEVQMDPAQVTTRA